MYACVCVTVGFCGLDINTIGAKNDVSDIYEVGDIKDIRFGNYERHAVLVFFKCARPDAIFDQCIAHNDTIYDRSYSSKQSFCQVY
jgi:hypothetical protein